MKLDGVIVRTIEGKSELRHRECVGGDAIENDSPVLRHPLRSDFATERAYTERIERAQTCTYCGGIIPEEKVSGVEFEGVGDSLEIDIDRSHIRQKHPSPRRG